VGIKVTPAKFVFGLLLLLALYMSISLVIKNSVLA